MSRLLNNIGEPLTLYPPMHLHLGILATAAGGVNNIVCQFCWFWSIGHFLEMFKLPNFYYSRADIWLESLRPLRLVRIALQGDGDLETRRC